MIITVLVLASIIATVVISITAGVFKDMLKFLVRLIFSKVGFIAFVLVMLYFFYQNHYAY